MSAGGRLVVLLRCSPPPRCQRETATDRAVRSGNAPSPDHAGARSAISSTWQRPTARHPGRSMPSHRRPILPSLRPGCRVVALREVGEMARTRTSHPPDLPHDPIISETCPPGEGALPCSWDGPLDCQALRVKPPAAARRHSGCWWCPWPSTPVRCAMSWLSLG